MRRSLRALLVPLALLLAVLLSPAFARAQDTAPSALPLPVHDRAFPLVDRTRGFWFQAPVDFRIVGLRVPADAGPGLQHVEVFKLASPPPAYPDTARGGQVFYRTGVPSGQIIPADLGFRAGEYVGILGAAGDASALTHSFSGGGDFASSVLGHPVTLTRFIAQSNIVATGGDQPYSSEPGAPFGRVEVSIAPAAHTVCALYDQTKAHKLGSTVPVKLQLCDADGANLSSATIAVQATGLTKQDNTASGVEDAGGANSPDDNFRYDAALGGTGGYIYNLSTTGLSSGTWALSFTVDGVANSAYTVRFDVK